MKTSLHTSPILICVCLIALAPAWCFAQQVSHQGNARRTLAKTTYNDSLKKLFADLEQAKTPEQLRSARSRAREGFKRALDQDPAYCLPYYNLGVLAEADGDRPAAIEYFEQFKKLSDRPALSLKAQQKLDYLRSADSASRKNAEYEEALRKVNALINLGLLKEAISVAARAAQLEPNRWESYALIGAALLDRKKYGDALGFLQQANSRAPANMQAKLSAAIKICETNIRP